MAQKSGGIIVTDTIEPTQEEIWGEEFREIKSKDLRRYASDSMIYTVYSEELRMYLEACKKRCSEFYKYDNYYLKFKQLELQYALIMKTFCEKNDKEFKKRDELIKMAAKFEAHDHWCPFEDGEECKCGFGKWLTDAGELFK